MNGQPTDKQEQRAARRQRLEELAKLISEGRYHVPTEWVAESILRWRGRAGRVN